ncbi:unnamed protein product [Gongylonema pulchrum]|uniref:Ovule protein n=1 Tax=Gongylonema pulchrum TaxID=637853 RepID=A0A183DIA1_9BILA|nr:unnamed protein product [Gongylonema pulchrum]
MSKARSSCAQSCLRKPYLLKYVGQYDCGDPKPKKRDKPEAHVQWNLQENQEKSISIAGTDDQFGDHSDSPPKSSKTAKVSFLQMIFHTASDSISQL